MEQRVNVSQFRDDELVPSAWRWLVSLGVATVFIGVLALMAAAATTMVTIYFIGAVLLLVAIVQMTFALSSGKWVGLGLHLLLAALYGMTGLYLLSFPLMGAASLTLLLSFALMTSGIFRIVSSLMLRFSGWGWAFLGGVVGTCLGVIVSFNLGTSSLVFLGTVMAFDLIFMGTHLMAFGMALRRIAPTGRKGAWRSALTS